MMVMHGKSESLSVPSPVKGHRHRRSAAISLDWRNIQLPPLVEPVPAAVAAAAADVAVVASSAACHSASGLAAMNMPACAPEAASTQAVTHSPTLTFASSMSDCSLGNNILSPELRPILSTQVSACRSPTRSNNYNNKRVSFMEEVQEIPAAEEEGDTWLKPEDYPWPLTPAGRAPMAAGGDPFAPSIDLAPAAATLVEIPGSPVLLHRKKRSSFLQTTKNVLSRRPSKSGSKKERAIAKDVLQIPTAPLIDLDAALGPAPALRHKRSGSLGNLPPSPIKPFTKGLGLQFPGTTTQRALHKRADSAPADMLISFTPRPSTPDSRKRKMSAIVEHPSAQASPMALTAATTTTTASTPATAGVIAVRTDYQFPSKPMEPDFVLFGEPGGLVDSRVQDEPLESLVALDTQLMSPSSSPPLKKKGWKGYLHRLLH